MRLGCNAVVQVVSHFMYMSCISIFINLIFVIIYIICMHVYTTFDTKGQDLTGCDKATHKVVIIFTSYVYKSFIMLQYYKGLPNLFIDDHKTP